MNKSQLIEALSNHFEGNKKTAQHALESVLDTITREVARGEKVALTGFGAFEKVIRPVRAVRNPRTGEQSTSTERAVPRFRAGSELRAVVSGDKEPPKSAEDTGVKTATVDKTAAENSASGDDPVKESTGSGPAASTPSTSSSAARQQAAKKSPAKRGSATKPSTTANKSAAEKTSSSKSSTGSANKSSTGSGAKSTTRKRSSKTKASSADSDTST